MANGRKRPEPPEYVLESDETTIQPSQLSRHEAQKHEEGYHRWCPRRARHVSDTRGCCRRIARMYLAWELSFAVLRDVRSCLLCDDARDCWCGWWRSCFMARLAKIREKKTNNSALDNNADVFSRKSWEKERKFREFTSSIRTALRRPRDIKYIKPTQTRRGNLPVRS